MRQDDSDDRLVAFLETLRAEARHRLPGRGVSRMVRSMLGAGGLAATILRARNRPGLPGADLASLERVVLRLGELKGIPMKAGQILGYLDVDLPDEMRRLLALLQTQSPATPFATVAEILRQDLGQAAGAVLSSLDPNPVSVASIGQVHRGRLPSGELVAVKVRHPGIEAAIRSDFGGASATTSLVRLLLPGAGATASEFVEEARTRFLEECDYTLEADRQRLFGRLFARHPDVVVPRVLDAWCTPRVLTTSWEEGRDLDAFLAVATQAERDRAGRALFEVYVATLYRHGLFHADPHPGNYRFPEGGKVVVFDYGCVRSFEPKDVVAFVDLAEAVRTSSEDRLRAALRGLGAEPRASPRALARARELLQAFFAPMLQPGVHRIDARIAFDLQRLTRDKLAIAQLRLPGKLLFLFRIRFGLYSVLARLGAICDWGALERGWADETRSP